MNVKLFAFVPLVACAAAHAEGPRIGFEFESEKEKQTGITNLAVTLAPGWEFPEENLISRVELLIERNRDTRADSEGVRGRETKVFLRLRHDGELTDRFGYYIRGGVGRSTNNERNFNFAYLEPAIEYKISERWEGVLAYRETDAIDHTPGERVHRFLLGPNVDIDKNNELELRYVKGNGDENVRSWVVEYVHRF